jgi:small conductance mechanosensitive channel
MRADDRFKRDILEPLEIAGVETFGDTTFIVRSRIKTRPIRQWDVGREFQRRLKRNLQARDIEMATPGLPAHVTIGGHGNGHAAAVAVAARRGKPDRPDNDA